MTFEQLNTVAAKSVKLNQIIFLVGEPGIGKTSWAKALAASMGTRCFCIPVNQLYDKADLTGARLMPILKPTTDENGNIIVNDMGEPVMQTCGYEQKFFPHHKINEAIDYALEHPQENPILFMDEMNRTTPDVTSAALSISTEREIGERQLPNNLRIICAGNDKGNIQALDQASISRFVKYCVEPDLTTFFKVNPGLNPYIKDTLSKNPSLLFCNSTISGISTANNAQTQGNQQNANDDDEDDGAFEEESETMDQITTPRTITGLSDFLNTCDYSELMGWFNTPDNGHTFLQSVIESYTGPTLFTISLIDQIISSQAKAPAAAQIQMPVKYITLASAPSRSEMENIISGCSEKEKMELLIYACYDNRDNANMISVLAPKIVNPAGECIPTFIQMKQSGQFSRANMDTLLQTDCPVTTLVHMMNL